MMMVRVRIRRKCRAVKKKPGRGRESRMGRGKRW
jgi:hypothetical protein